MTPLLIVVLAVIGLAGFWQWLEFEGFLAPEAIRSGLEGLLELREWNWLPLALMAVFVIASLVVFPLSVLVAVTGMIYGSVLGIVWAAAGTLLAAAVTFWVGHWVGREPLLRHGGRRLNRLADVFQQRGVRTSAVVALLPLAPFTLTNLLAGAFRIRFRDFMLGTTVGIMPGLVAVTLVGSELVTWVLQPEMGNLVRGALLVGAAVIGLMLLRMWLRRRLRADDGREA